MAPSPVAKPRPPRDASTLAWVEQSVSQLSLAHRTGGRRMVTIDDLAERLPSSKKAPVLTSPRSIKVCLEHGIDPAMLVPKSLADFADPRLSHEHQRLKWEHHESVRQERLEVLNEARDALPEAPMTAIAMVPGVAGASGRHDGFLQPELSRNFSSQDYSSGNGIGVKAASTVKEEQRRLETVQRRADKEIAAMELARERLEQRQMVIEEKVRRAEQVEEERARERSKLDKQRQRETYARVQLKKAEEEQEQKEQRRDLERRFQLNEDMRRRKEEQEKEERAARQRAEKEKLRKVAEFKEQTDAILHTQAAAILRKKEVMERKDAARHAYMEEERTEMAVVSERRRLEFDRRREETKARSENVMDVRRRSIIDKAAEVHHRQLSRAEEVGERRMQKAADNALKSHYKAEVYEEARTAQRKKIDHLLDREQREEHRVQLIGERKKREAALKSLNKGISVDERREKVECMRRYKDYQNAQLLEKIERDTAKARAILAAKEELRATRRETNRVLNIQREQLRKDMDERAARAKARMNNRSATPGPGGRAGRGTSQPPRPRSAMA